MIVLGCEKIGFSVGVTDILREITFSVEEKERVGIVGVNGAGKSTLIKIISGENTDHTGTVYIAKDKSVGVLKQNADFDSDKSLIGELLDSFSHLQRMEEELKELQERIDAGDGELSSRFSALHDKFMDEGGFEYKGRCASTLKSLGFSEEEQKRPVSSFSGGQKTRVALAKVLSQMPDLLILDEPTNHLDLKALTWLEDFLRSYPKTVLVVSHDRYFLDRVTTKTVEIEHGKSHVYGGGYTYFVEQKKKDREIQQRHYENQQREIRRQEAYIEQQRRWNRERNIIAAESRQKALDRMEKVERPEDLPEDIRLTFGYSGDSGNEVLNTYYLAKSYGENKLFSGLNLTLRKGERLFIFGANGSGKSTLIKILNGFERASGGSFDYGYNVVKGYYDQENQQLEPDNTVLEELWRTDPGAAGTAIRNRLALFLFKGDDVYKNVRDLSGGEKARLTLAKLSMNKTNLLILDEPTNHLDIGTREVLEEALSRYEGTLIAVSHDRYFVDKLATRMLYLAGDGSALDYIGNYRQFDSYISSSVTATEVKGSAPAKETTDAKADFMEQKRIAAAKRKNEQRITRATAEAQRLETLLESLEKETAATDGADYVKLSELYKQKEEAEESLFAAYEEIESAEAELAKLQ